MTKDPIEWYNMILHEKTAWNCGILEAADRVAARLAAEQGHAQAEWLPPGTPAIARVRSRPGDIDAHGAIQC